MIHVIMNSGRWYNVLTSTVFLTVMLYHQPEQSVCFHYYAKQDTTGQRKKVKLFWENQKVRY